MSLINHINNAGTNLTSNQSSGVTTTPINSVPSISAPFYAVLDATNVNGHYEVVLVTSKTATNINHAATTYAHTTAEEVRFAMVAAEADSLWDHSSTGWVDLPSSITWTYASATTITVPSGAASLFSVGDKIKLTQTTVKYFYIVSVADTLLTVTGGSDYTVANAAITSPCVSHMSNPVGFPQWFNYTPTGVTNTTLTGRFTVNGRLCTTQIKGVLTGTPVFNTQPTLPITAGSSFIPADTDYNAVGVGGYLDSGAANKTLGIVPHVAGSATSVRMDSQANSAVVSPTNPITWATNDVFWVYFTYEI